MIFHWKGDFFHSRVTLQIWDSDFIVDRFPWLDFFFAWDLLKIQPKPSDRVSGLEMLGSNVPHCLLLSPDANPLRPGWSMQVLQAAAEVPEGQEPLTQLSLWALIGQELAASHRRVFFPLCLYTFMSKQLPLLSWREAQCLNIIFKQTGLWEKSDIQPWVFRRQDARIYF